MHTKVFELRCLMGFRERSLIFFEHWRWRVSGSAHVFLKASAMVDFRVAIVRRACYGASHHAAAGERFAETAKFD